MSLAIFDLDNTLLAGDSDHLWGEFLAEQGIVNAQWYRSENERFYEAYKAGTLNIYEFLAFSLKPLADNDLRQLMNWHRLYMQQKIEPIILPKALAQIAQHREQGDHLMIITATNQFVTQPIAAKLGIETLLATQPEFENNRYTGKVTGIPCFQEGKVHRLQAWLQQSGHDLNGSWFYSDSHNDIPLLRTVCNPVAVDPDPLLARHAQIHGWAIMSFR